MKTEKQSEITKSPSKPEGFVISKGSLEEIKSQIDILLNKKSIEPLTLILPVNNARFIAEYRGFKIRQWQYDGRTRYDTAYKNL